MTIITPTHEKPHIKDLDGKNCKRFLKSDFTIARFNLIRTSMKIKTTNTTKFSINILFEKYYILSQFFLFKSWFKSNVLSSYELVAYFSK